MSAVIRSGLFKHVGTSRCLQLVADTANTKCILLLDSGASNNFISLSTCVKLNLPLHNRSTVLDIRLANGKVLKSQHYIEQLVDFN